MQKNIMLVPTIPKPEKKKRVAAYARVSSGKDAMMHSLSAQVSRYSELIQSHNDWFYAGVYADEAKTGTKDTRENFLRLIDDCRNGKIDMIITKSISRFARNTVTLLETVRDLKAWKVDIYFEEQNIHTMSSDGELLLTILASYAQEESRSASENQKWRIKRNFEQGLPWNGVILGYRMVDSRYVIVPHEAEIVRRIFKDYLSGMGHQTIANSLNNDGILSRFGNRWNKSSIQTILSDYCYTGNLLLQTTYRENYITKRRKKNKGELPLYHSENAHEAIIDIETFQAVQDERERRMRYYLKQPVPKKTFPFSGRLKCEICGKNYRRKVVRGKQMWICDTFNNLGKSVCASKQVPEDILYAVTADALGLVEFSEEIFHEQVKYVLVCNGNKLIYNFSDGRQIEKLWKHCSRSESWTNEMKEKARQKALERRKSNA